MTLQQLFRKPKSWTQKTMARRRSGHSCNATSRAAVCFCLWGAIDRCYPDFGAERSQVIQRIKEAVWRRASFCQGIADWNDAKGRTISEIRKLVKDANV